MFESSLNNPVNFVPDYSAGVTISEEYTAYSDGFIVCIIFGNQSQDTTINGYKVATTYNTGVSSSYLQLCMPVSKGDVFKTNSNLWWAIFYPRKGAN